MGFSDIAGDAWDSTKDFGNALGGNINKAVLCVLSPEFADADTAYLDSAVESLRSFREELDRKKQEAKETDKAISEEEKKAAEQKDSELQKLITEGKQGALNGIYEKLSTAGKGMDGGEVTKTLARDNNGDKKYVAMEVKYNPSSIRISTMAGQEVSVSAEDPTVMKNKKREKAETNLSCQLVFEDVNVHDAFMLSNITPNIGNLVQAGKNIYNKTEDKEGSYDVSIYVDAMFGLLARPVTRNVIFYWSSMIFPGELTSVRARYTMFNKSGNPIRAVVDMTIRQEYSEETQKYWGGVFNQYFKDVESGKSTIADNLDNNFLNLNI